MPNRLIDGIFVCVCISFLFLKMYCVYKILIA